MKAFTNANAARPRSTRVDARAATPGRGGSAPSFAGGGSDLLGLVKDRLVAPDVVVSLKTIAASTRSTPRRRGVTDRRADHARRARAVIRDRPAGLRGAGGGGESVATPQIRNVGTLAGNVCQRPWCWYYRNGFPCYKNGGNECFSVAGENQFHAIFGGGPSYIVHPSDTAPALVALDATFRIVGPGGRADGAGRRVLRAADRQNAARENVLGGRRGAGRGRSCRPAGRARAAPTTRCSIAKRGPTPSSARRSCSRWSGDVCRSARASCLAAWRRFRGGCRRWRSCSPGSGSRRRSPRKPAMPPSPARGRWRRTPTRCR